MLKQAGEMTTFDFFGKVERLSLRHHRLWMNPQADTGESMLKQAGEMTTFDFFGKVERLSL
jgi:hypothetical protein